MNREWRLLTVQEVADRIGRSRSWVYYRIADGRFHALCLDGRYYVWDFDVEMLK